MGEGAVEEGAVRKGRRGEALAAEHLERTGWMILDRNWRDGPRELDLVAWREGVLAFIEVKTRRDPSWGHPLESLGRSKRAEVERAARAWLRDGDDSRPPEESSALRENVGSRPSMIRFDAIVVWLRSGRDPMVEHIPDAWRPGWFG